MWKKWVPSLGSTWKFCRLHSTMTLASEMLFQLMGMPSQGSDEPHLPGPAST
ncbi:MAG: hypothetical protein WCR22_05945 [Bacteroidales bacterium]